MAGEMQKDLVLNPNEYAYILDRTKGIVNCYCGPTKTSLSNTDAPVVFDSRSKRFVECRLEDAIHLFVTAPENWYCVLKNPDPSGGHPSPRAVNELPQLQIGRKVNITGPCSFALYPGQMANVIQGHRLRSNQYLLVRVYDEKAARDNWNSSIIKSASTNTPKPADPKPDSENNENLTVVATPTVEPEASAINSVNVDDLVVGKIMVIKGTEVSFYIPPTGIEVIPVDGSKTNYIREAVTLERLEYCILKDEDGNKRYVHGPDVVFPKPTESFIASGNRENGYKFRAIELSEISGIYIKVIAEYEDKTGHHNVGEEMFITGKETMIYYPRPEHAIVTYDNRILHHAVAIPAGEGRYVMNRMTGKIDTVKGPVMFLPDPRKQVIVKRKLTRSQASLWYPGNEEVLAYNESLGEPEGEAFHSAAFDAGILQSKSSANFEPGSYLNRGTKFTPPRTITIDNKFDGVVSIDVWTGYAINVISKDGTRKVVVGPCTYLMGYDETLEILEMSTGKPKTTDQLIRTTYLRVDNNKIGDIISVQTKDFVNIDIKVSYCVNFDREAKDTWFSVENYVKYLCDRIRSLLKQEAKRHTIEDFYQNCTSIVRKVALNLPDEKTEASDTTPHVGRYFKENGMIVSDVEVLSVNVDRGVAEILAQHQYDMIRNTIKLSDAEQREAMAKRLAESTKTIADIEHESEMYKIGLETDTRNKKAAQQAAIAKLEAEAAMRDLKALESRQAIMDSINDSEIAREINRNEMIVEHQTQLTDLAKRRQDAYAAAVSVMLGAISPQLSASIENLASQTTFAEIAQKLSPLTIVNGESIADTANKLMKGTALEGLFDALTNSSVMPIAATPENPVEDDEDY